MRNVIAVLFTLLLMILPVSAQQAEYDLACGAILESELFPPDSDELVFDEYVLDVGAGTRIDLSIVPLGQNFNLGFVVLDSAGTELEYHNEQIEGIAEGLENFSVGGSNQRIRVYGTRPSYSASIDYVNDYGVFFNNSRGYAGTFLGAYQISLGCTDRGGNVINPGDNASPSDSGNRQTVTKPIFMGFGFPGITPVDFANGIEIPIALGTPQTTPLAGDLVALYTYDATAESTATLSLSRMSGDIDVGVTVIQKETNDIMFLGGLLSSNNLSVELTFPVDGTYVIGLFSLPPMSGSGAVQVTLE